LSSTGYLHSSTGLRAIQRLWACTSKAAPYSYTATQRSTAV
jgi:hypothetical protein